MQIGTGSQMMVALYTHNNVPLVLLHCRIRFAFLNREDTKDIQNVANSAKYAEKVENSKVPRGAQVRIEHKRYCCARTCRCLERRSLALYEGLCTALQMLPPWSCLAVCAIVARCTQSVRLHPTVNALNVVGRNKLHYYTALRLSRLITPGEMFVGFAMKCCFKAITSARHPGEVLATLWPSSCCRACKQEYEPAEGLFQNPLGNVVFGCMSSQELPVCWGRWYNSELHATTYTPRVLQTWDAARGPSSWRDRASGRRG